MVLVMFYMFAILQPLHSHYDKYACTIGALAMHILSERMLYLLYHIEFIIYETYMLHCNSLSLLHYNITCSYHTYPAIPLRVLF